MNGTAVADAPSLTLPDWRTAIKKRIKRKPPKNRFAWVFKVLTFVFGIENILFYVLDPKPSYLISAMGDFCQWVYWREVADGKIGNFNYLLAGACLVLSTLVMP